MSGGRDNLLKIWNIETGSNIQTMVGHTNCITSITDTSDKIISGSWDCTLRIWSTNGNCIQIIEACVNGISSVDSTNDGKHLVTGSYDNNIKIW
jgi:WD40 repeat protein